MGIAAKNADEEAYVHAILEGLEGKVRQLPRLEAVREVDDRHFALAGEPRVKVPWGLLAGANSMSRSRP